MEARQGLEKIVSTFTSSSSSEVLRDWTQKHAQAQTRAPDEKEQKNKSLKEHVLSCVKGTGAVIRHRNGLQDTTALLLQLVNA